jgi:nitroreductase
LFSSCIRFLVIFDKGKNNKIPIPAPVDNLLITAIVKITSMNLLEIIKKRRSIRRFTSKEVEKEKIEALLEAGMYAPSAVNKQPWHFIVIDDHAVMKRIMEAHPHSKMFETANIGVLVCGDFQLQHGPGYWIADCAAATENILLAATALGLGSCWVGIYPREDRMKVMKEIFVLPEHVEGFALIALGYPAEEKKMPERFQPERIYLNRWGKSF